MSDYVLKVSKRQLRLLSRMAELYGRISVGDFEAVADAVRCLSPADNLAALRKLDEAKQLLTGLPQGTRHRTDSHQVEEETRVALDLYEDLSRELTRDRCVASPMRTDDIPRRHSVAEPPIEIDPCGELPPIRAIAA